MNRDRLILIVEDEPDWANLLRHHLERAGYRTAVAADGRRALDLAFAHKPDLVILDLLLPELHGLTVCQILNQSRQLRRVPVVVLTALAEPDKRVASHLCGAVEFLAKPISPAAVLASVRPLLETRVSCTKD
jgi:DNA-binding response OmpR family regulator